VLQQELKDAKDSADGTRRGRPGCRRMSPNLRFHTGDTCAKATLSYVWDFFEDEVIESSNF